MAQNHLPHYADDCCFNLDIFGMFELNMEPLQCNQKWTKQDINKESQGV